MDTETISVTLPAEAVRAIREKVDSGAYTSADEVIEEALRQLDDKKIESPEFSAYMREKIWQSIEDPRPSVPIEEAFERLRKRHEERLKAARDDV
jgi:antitoxin ParD1/3/4